MSLRNSSTFCSMGWNHQFVGPGGNIKPCCRFIDDLLPASNNIRDNALEDIFTSSYMDDLRNDFKNGIRHPGCVKCWEEEDAGKRMSIRENYNRENIEHVSDLHKDIDPEHPKITWLELSFSNLCPVRCRTCGPAFSTNWYKDWETVNEYVPVPFDYTKNIEVPQYLATHKTPLSIDTSKFDSVLPNIRHLKMTGGEPLIIPEYREILKKLINIGQAKHVYLNYSTSLTIVPDDEIINIWKEFQYVEFSTSLDGVGNVYEYQRYPSKWPVVIKVLKKLFELQSTMNIRIGTRPTICIYNVLDIPNITNYWIETQDKYGYLAEGDQHWINHTHLAQPAMLSITVLPEHLKAIVKDKLSCSAPTKRQQVAWDHIVNYMYSVDNSHLLPHFKDFTLKLDAARNENMAEVIPEFAELIL